MGNLLVNHITDSNSLLYFKDFKKSIIKILLILPINDSQLFSYILRYSSEAAIKSIYCKLYPDEKLNSVDSMSFRCLRDKIEDKLKDEELSKLYKVYKDNSINIHGKTCAPDFDFLGDILKANSIANKTNEKKIINLYDSLYCLVIKVYEIKHSDFNQANKKLYREISANPQLAKIINVIT